MQQGHGGDANSPVEESPGLALERRIERSQNVALCVETHRKHALPSAAVRFVARTGKRGSQKNLQDAVTPLLRSTDLTTHRGGEHPNLTVLLPMEGRSEAERLIEQVTSNLDMELDANLSQTEDFDSTERFMERLGDRG